MASVCLFGTKTLEASGLLILRIALYLVCFLFVSTVFSLSRWILADITWHVCCLRLGLFFRWAEMNSFKFSHVWRLTFNASRWDNARALEASKPLRLREHFDVMPFTCRHDISVSISVAFIMPPVVMHSTSIIRFLSADLRAWKFSQRICISRR